MLTTTNLLISKPSFGGTDFKEAIDLALVCAAFEQRINLIFVGFGISNLIEGQSSLALKDKNHSDIIKGLEYYDIDSIILEKESLEQSCITKKELFSCVQIKSSAEINTLNLRAKHLLVF